MAAPAQRPSPRAIWLWTIQAALIWLVPFAVQLGWALLDSSGSPVPHLVVLLVSLVLSVTHVVGVPRWRYAVHRWEIDASAVYTRTGWFIQESRVAPISRVQTVDTERGPLERLLGLATITVTTASSAGAVQIAALDNDVADAAVARLTEIGAGNRDDAT